MKEKFKNIIFYINIVVDIIVIVVVLYFLINIIVNKIKTLWSIFDVDSINNKIKDYGSIRRIKCDELQINKIMYLTYDYVVFENGEMYSLLNDEEKLYSNNQQCKKIDLSFSIKKITDSFVVDENNNIYRIDYSYNSDVQIELNEDNTYDVRNMLLKNNTIKSGSIYFNDGFNNGEQKYIVLKDDGNIYEQLYNYNYDDFGNIKISLINEKVFLSSENYGKIEFFELNDSGEINRLNTSNGVYILKEIGDNCKKYQDIKCDKELVLSEVYKKYANEITYIGLNSLTKDNVIFSLEVFDK